MASVYVKDKYATEVIKKTNDSLVEYTNEAVRQRLVRDGYIIETKEVKQ